MEYNYVHDYGAGVTNDFGGLKTGSKAKCQDQSTDEQFLASNCFTHIRLFNNLVRDSFPYHCCDSALYSDMAGSKTTFENNLVFGSGGAAISFNCGIENEAKNNFIHREAKPTNGHKALGQVWNGCNRKRINTYSNHHNVYYFDNTDNLIFYQPWMRFDQDTVFYKNLYFSLEPTDQTKGMFPPDEVPFSSFRTARQTGSQWVDPEFSSAGGHNYTLLPTSPARYPLRISSIIVIVNVIFNLIVIIVIIITILSSPSMLSSSSF